MIPKFPQGASRADRDGGFEAHPACQRQHRPWGTTIAAVKDGNCRTFLVVHADGDAR